MPLSLDGTGSIIGISTVSVSDDLTHVGDVNTKISFPANDTISFETSGSEKVRIDSSGRLLIGTTTEGVHTADDLTIAAANGTTGITLRSGTGNPGNIFFSDGTSGDAEFVGFIQYYHADNSMSFATNNTVRLKIKSDGTVGINTTGNFGSIALSIYGADVGEGTAKGQLILKDNAAYDASPTAGIVFQGIHAAGSQAIFAGIRGLKENALNGNYAGALAFDVRAHGAVAFEAVRIDSSGRLLVGQDSSINGIYGSPPPRFSVSTTTASPAIFATYSNDTYASRVDLVKSRATSVGTHTVVQAGDALGELYFGGSDGDQYHAGALIQAVVESGVGNDDMPANLRFYTNNGSTTVTESLRIGSTGILNAPSQAGFYARMNANKNDKTGDGTYYTVEFDTDSGSICYDQHNTFSTSTGLYQIPTGGDGVYQFTTAVCLSTDVYGRQGEGWFLTNTGLRIFFDRRYFTSTTGTITGFYGSCIAKMTAGQTMGVQIFVNGGAKNVDVFGAGAGDHVTWFSGRKIA